MKITSIQFFDYRAFFNGENDYYLLKIDGKNLLIYGENGSGKTSFYRGLKDFFYGEDFILHNQTPRLNEGFIEVSFSDGTVERLEASGVKPTRAEIVNTPKLHSFLSYRELLRTHLEDTEEINFFDLMVNNLLGEHILDSLGPLKKAWGDEQSKNIANDLLVIQEALEKGDINPEEAIEQQDIADGKIKQEHDKFIDELKLLLTQINDKLTSILNYFNQNVEVELKIESIDWSKPEGSKISTEVKYYGIIVSPHHEFLNEARLSALAISIYFAAIKLNPTQNAFKLLFLDDIFLGLDMSNRLPLLRIFNSEFKEWQIFITTYDRHWYEVAKFSLSDSQWDSIEMYSTYVDALNFEVPIIYSNSLNYLGKAQFYFKRGNIDYPACGNYLRKEFERVLKDLLYGKYLLSSNSKTGEVKRIEELGDLWSNFYSSKGSLLEKLGFEKIIYQEFDELAKTILNPLSHDNLDKPIYKGELEMAFSLLEKLNSIEKIILLQAGCILKIETYNYGTKRETFIKLLHDLLGYRQLLTSKGQSKKININIPEFKVKPLRLEENGETTNLFHLPECNINKAYDMVYHSVFGILNASTLKGFDLNKEVIDVDSGLSLQLLIDSI